jgi:hypothetical protein
VDAFPALPKTVGQSAQSTESLVQLYGPLYNSVYYIAATYGLRASAEELTYERRACV